MISVMPCLRIFVSVNRLKLVVILTRLPWPTAKVQVEYSLSKILGTRHVLNLTFFRFWNVCIVLMRYLRRDSNLMSEFIRSSGSVYAYSLKGILHSVFSNLAFQQLHGVWFSACATMLALDKVHILDQICGKDCYCSVLTM